MTTAAAVVGGLSHLEPRADSLDSDWLTRARGAAFGWVGQHGFPTLKDEDWRYTRLGPILEAPFEAAVSGVGHQVSSAMIDASVADMGGTRLVFVNGYFASELSLLTELPGGVTVTNLASALADKAERLEPFFSRPLGPQHHAFTALNAALAEDGAFIHLRAGTTVDEPIQLVFFSDTAGPPLLSSPRSVVLAGPGSQVTIVETYVGVPGGVYCTNAVTDVVLEEGARVEHYKVQDESETAFHLALLDVRQGRDSRFSSHSIALGSRIARHEVRVHLEAEGAEVSLDGMYMPCGDPRPVCRGRADDLGFIVPARQQLIALGLEKSGAVLDDIGRDSLGGEVGRNIPIGVERGESDQGRHHRRRMNRFADDNAHRIDGLAILIHRQSRGRGVDDDIFAGRSGQRSRAFEVEAEQIALQLIVTNATGQRLAEPGVDRAHPWHVGQILFD